MDFVLFDQAQYRALEIDALEARRDAVVAELSNADSKFGVAELRSEVEMCEAEFERRNAAINLRKASIAAVEAGAGTVTERTLGAPEAEVDVFATRSYERAFMDYCQRGVAMPTEYRANDGGTIINTPTVTTGVPPQIPSTMMAQIITKMETYGDIWNRVRKMSVKGGIQFRILDLSPNATWLMKGSNKNELSVSGYQGVTNDAVISFSFYELECRMAQSLLAAATTFDDFQRMFVDSVAKAMVKALEQAIVRGDGVGQFQGIVGDARITNTVSMKAADMADWKAWHSKVDAAILPEYDNGGFIMAKSTWNKYVDTLTGTDGHAVAEFHYDPVSGKRVNTLMGKPVMLVSTAILPDYAAATNGEVFCIYGDLNDYVVNTQPGMPLSTVRWIDHETNTEKIKSLMAADGKVLDPYGFMLIKKDTAA